MRGCIFGIIYFAVIALVIVSWWKVFAKAGKPGWAAIVPIYNIIVILEIVEKPVWWIILMFIPVVSIVVWIMVAVGLAEKFGKSAGFGVGVALLAIIFVPILAFGDAKYVGAAAAPPVQAPPVAAPPVEAPPQTPPEGQA